MKKFKKNITAKFKKLSRKGVPLTLVLVFTFNVTFGAMLIQHYVYRQRLNQILEANNLPADLSSDALFEELIAKILPPEGYNTGLKWDDLGKRLVEIGAIDQERFLDLYRQRSGDVSDFTAILEGTSDEYIYINEWNANFVLNVLWALGLAQSSKVLNEGMMMSFEDGPGGFASTGGWTMARGHAMDIYGKHDLIPLTDTQQDLTYQIAGNIYRPCCNNSTAFPDCNHGMAMLGLIELMVYKGYSEEEIYQAALAFNSFWFPETYITIATFMKDRHELEWENTDARLALSANFSSGSGYSSIQAQVQNQPNFGGGGGCGV
jgi:hypothetical protein